MHRKVWHKIAVEKVVYHDGHSERSGDYYEEESKTMFRSCTSSLVLRLYKPRKPRLYTADKAHQAKMSKSWQESKTKRLKFRGLNMGKSSEHVTRRLNSSLVPSRTRTWNVAQSSTKWPWVGSSRDTAAPYAAQSEVTPPEGKQVS